MQKVGAGTFYVLVVVCGCKDPPTLQPSSLCASPTCWPQCSSGEGGRRRVGRHCAFWQTTDPLVELGKARVLGSETHPPSLGGYVWEAGVPRREGAQSPRVLRGRWSPAGLGSWQACSSSTHWLQHGAPSRVAFAAGGEGGSSRSPGARGAWWGAEVWHLSRAGVFGGQRCSIGTRCRWLHSHSWPISAAVGFVCSVGSFQGTLVEYHWQSLLAAIVPVLL